MQIARPRMLAYELVESPIGQVMWTCDEFHRWTYNQRTPEGRAGIESKLDAFVLLVHDGLCPDLPGVPCGKLLHV